MPLPLELVSTILTTEEDAFFACRCARVCKGWRDLLADDAFWRSWAEVVSLTEQDRKDFVFEGWCDTRSGIYRGPLKLGRFGTPQTAAELAFQRTYKCLVVGWSTFRRDNKDSLVRWRYGFEFTGDKRYVTRVRKAPSRRSTRSVLPAGGVTAPAPASFADMVAWRREIERVSGGWVMTRTDMEVIGLFGGSERWHKEKGLALRLFTPDEILTFLESGGREPKDVGQLFGQVRPLRTDDADFSAPMAWPCSAEKLWLPIGDFRHSGEAPSMRGELAWDPKVSHLLVVCFERDETPLQYYVDCEWDTCSAPFGSLSHFAHVTADIVHDPDYFLTSDWASDTDHDDSDDLDLDDDEAFFQHLLT